MMQDDAVLNRLAALAPLEPGESVSAKIRTMALQRLALRKVHPLWNWVVAASCVCYLAWALRFVVALSLTL